jgi:type IV pilus assembly protein PilE
MVIVAILAAIAIPSYTSYVRKGRRTDAKSAVLDLASLEERYFSLNNKYSLTATDFGYTAFPASIGSGSNPDYQLNVTLPNAGTSTQQATYSITATAYGDQVNDTQCNQFTLTSAGIQGSYTSASAANSEPGTCW